MFAVIASIALPIGAAAGVWMPPAKRVRGLSQEAISWPMGFAAGAVLASLAVTLMPEAFEEGGPLIAFATALGFLASYLISAG